MENNATAIIGAMAQEVALLQKAMTNCEETKLAGTTIYQGSLEGKPVVLMQCGIGKVNAAIGTAILLNHFHATSVINTGSAGALSDELQVGDVVIADKLLHHDVDVTAFGYTIGQMAQMPEYYMADTQLVNSALNAAHTFPHANVHSGLITSGDQFIHSESVRKHIKQLFPSALAVEMEAAAIAQVCYRFDVPFVIIRAISDNANGDADVSFDQFLEMAAKHSAAMVRSLLTDIA